MANGRGSFVLLLLYAGFTPIIAVGGLFSFKVGTPDFLLIPVILFLLTRRQLRSSPLSLVCWLYVALGLVSALVNWLLGGNGVGITSALQYIRSIGSLLPLFLVVGDFDGDYARIRKLGLTMVISGSLSCLIGIFLYHSGVQVRDSQQVLWGTDGARSSLRAGGILGNSSDFGHLAATLFAVALVFGVLYDLNRVAVAAACAVSLYAIWIASSRAALLHVAVMVLFFGLFLLHRARREVVILLLFLLALVVVSFPAISESAFWDTPGGARLDMFGFGESSVFLSSTTRLSTWQMARGLFLEDPWFGAGYGAILDNLGQAGDNSFISSTVELGVFAGFAFLLIWLVLLSEIGRAPLVSTRLLGLGVVLGEIAHLMTLDGMRLWSSMPLFMIVGGILYSRSRDERLYSGKAEE